MSPETVEKIVSRDRDLADTQHFKVESLFVCADIDCNTISNNSRSCPSCASRQMIPLGNYLGHQKHALAHRLALSHAKIEVFSNSIARTKDGQSWYDTSCYLNSSERANIDLALSYLEAVNVLIRHSTAPSLVRWE